jgi:hypothetical protein
MKSPQVSVFCSTSFQILTNSDSCSSHQLLFSHKMRGFKIGVLKSKRRTFYFCIALGYGLEDRGFKSRQRLGIFLFTTVSRTVLGPTQPPMQWVQGVLSPGVKRPGREADHSPPSSAEVKNAWSYTSTPQYAFIAWCSVEAQGQLYPYTLFTD